MAAKANVETEGPDWLLKLSDTHDVSDSQNMRTRPLHTNLCGELQFACFDQQNLGLQGIDHAQ